MNSLKVRLLVGLVLAVALAWGAGQGIRAAAGAAPAKPALTAASPNGTTTAAAKTATATPAKSTAASPAPAPKAPQQGKMIGQAMTPQQMKSLKITPAQRKAAADALKAKKAAALASGVTLSAVPVSGMVFDATGALVPDYFGGTPNWAFSPQPTVDTSTTPWTVTAGGLRKFVDTLPDLPIAVPDTTTFPGSDYYEIELFESSWTFHLDMSVAPFTPTKLRMYRQTPSGNVNTPPAPGYLGPVIIAQKGRPTRIKFTNSLPLTGAGGELFIPTDTTVMGTGAGYDPVTNTMGTYPQNRATLHLHGGFTPWISDGTPHQWVTPTGEGGVLTTGVSTQPVPDMPIPPGNSMTFYWTNEQSGRLMFYHDHAYGITRLNVYAGEAAGYLLTDPVERALNTTLGVQNEIPLVIQDKTFVWGTPPANCALMGGTGTWATDPTWCDPIRKWSQAPGSLWFPHVYMPNQNPYDVTGANGMGRWDYALWFWPPFTGLITNGSVQDPYGPTGQMIPGTPNPSLVPEAMMDTPVVNGKAYPTKQVPAGLVRLRILNATNDRFLNLSLWVAADKRTATTSTPIAGLPTAATKLCNGVDVSATDAQANCTEVKMVPFNSTQNASSAFPVWWYTPGNFLVFDDRAGGVPDPLTRGPAMIQIGTEGGLLPQPAVILNQPVNFTYNPKNIVVGSVEQHALLLGPAERADVVVDFGPFAGQTLILYNDSPAPIPAADIRLDYFTGGGGLDRAATGGTTMTLPGYGPNTRTVMRFEVLGSGGTGGPDYVNSTLCTAAVPSVYTGPGPVACTSGTLSTALPAAFRQSQDPILVPQAAYSAAYQTAFTDATGVNVSRISDTFLTFAPLDPTCLPGLTTPCALGPTAFRFNFQPKAIQELFELDYGRMNATLGVELPFTNGGNQTTLPMGYIEPATEIINSSGLTPLPPTGTDGTQLWKVTHNGVDTHAIHVHLFNVQVINRVGWDGAIRLPELNELGWKETVRMNPLEDIIVALRPTTPPLPFGVPDSMRLMAPALAPGTLIDTFDTTTGNPMQVANAPYNFGWEYVWHCHLLGHEENDMMRPTAFHVPSAVPDAPAPVAVGGGVVTWTDWTPITYTNLAADPNLGNAQNEIGFRIARSTDGGAFTPVGTAPANTTSFNDLSAPVTGNCAYQVVAYNAAGDSPPATGPAAPCNGGLSPQSVTFTGAPASATSGATFTVTATTNAGVMPTITSTGVCTVGTVTGTAASASAPISVTSAPGTCSLTANWAATASYAAAIATQTTSVTLVQPTITWATPSPITYGTALNGQQLNATASYQNLAVPGTFTYTPAAGTVLNAGSWTLSTIFTPTDGAKYASATATVTLQVNKASTTASITSSVPNPSVAGQPVTFNFTVTGVSASAPTGIVTVSASSGETCNGTISGTAPTASGNCSITFAASGSRTITATYGGNGNYLGGSSSSFNQAVWDFAVGVNPGSQSVNGGQKASYTLTVTSLGGFNALVGLTCNAGPFTCTVTPTSVTPNGSAKNATVTVNTVKGTTGTFTLTFTGTYGTGAPLTGGLTHAVNPKLSVKR